jgi:holo-[acyl-carrier protein] synthase
MARISKQTQAFIAEQIAQGYSKEQLGLGVEIVSIERVEKIIKRTPSFVDKIFSKSEKKYCNKFADPAVHYAVYLAAKGAAIKALHVSKDQGISYSEIEVERRDAKPVLSLKGRVAEIAKRTEVIDTPISLGHTANEATCCALAITRSSVESLKNKTNTVDELTKQFKETRGLLDDI